MPSNVITINTHTRYEVGDSQMDALLGLLNAISTPIPLCEGCGEIATTQDVEGVALCDKCKKAD